MYYFFVEWAAVRIIESQNKKTFPCMTFRYSEQKNQFTVRNTDSQKKNF